MPRDGLRIGMMDAAIAPPARCRTSGDIQFRDGLLLAVLSLWPMRRRSIAALTIDRHLEFDSEGINILLHREDTKSKRAESCRLHEQLVPYLTRYLSEVRPRFYGSGRHKGLWASQQGCPLTQGDSTTSCASIRGVDLTNRWACMTSGAQWPRSWPSKNLGWLGSFQVCCNTRTRKSVSSTTILLDP